MAFYDFEAIKASVDILKVAQDLGLELKKSGAGYRAPCPTCNGQNARGVVITPGKGFYCFAEQKGGDVIGMVKHLLALDDMKDAAAWLTEQYQLKVQSTGTVLSQVSGQVSQPQNEKSGNQPAPRFDPDAFASKLTPPEGMSEADSKSFRVGMHRGSLYVAAVYQSGSIAGWWKVEDGKLIAPKTWLPDQSNVVQLKRPA